MKWPEIIPADIDWRDGAPVSRPFGDIYFLPGKGAAEKQYVFLDGIGLEDLCKSKKRIVVGEIGFGAGLNFLLTRQAAKKYGVRLDYLAVEGFPLAKLDLKRVLEGVSLDKGQFLEKYPPLVPGFHRLNFGGGITLTLVFGDVVKVLPEVSGLFDAWYLDGFSPEKNPEMWSPELLKNLARLSNKEARIATYSAAGFVRRGLEEAGFKVTKRKGFDQKRECLSGVFEGKNQGTGLPLGSKIAVAGGGIAGCSAAYTLNRKGYRVVVFEKEKTLAAGTSGHPLAVIMPKFNKSPTAYSVFMLAAYLYSLSLYDELEKETPGIWHPERGILEAAGDPETLKSLHRLAKIFPGLSDHLKATKTGLEYPKAGCLVPKTLAQALTKNIDVRLGRNFENPKGFDAIIYATGHRAFDAFAKSPFRLTRGQLSALPAAGKLPKQTLAFPGGYLTPEAEDGTRYLGTSFKVWKNPKDQTWQELSEKDFKTNLEAFSKVFGPLPEKWKTADLQGRAALRAETIDHLAVAGPAFDEKKFRTVFEKKQKLHYSRREMSGEADIKGVFVLSGFASRGFTAAPYAAEILADLIAGKPPPAAKSILAALSPARFLLKKLKQG